MLTYAFSLNIEKHNNVNLYYGIARTIYNNIKCL